MLSLAGLVLAIAHCGLVSSAPGNNDFSQAADTTFISSSGDVHVLNSNGTGAVLILDYGNSVEGIPSFEVVSHEGDTSVFEISYGESKTAFDEYMVRR